MKGVSMNIREKKKIDFIKGSDLVSVPNNEHGVNEPWVFTFYTFILNFLLLLIIVFLVVVDSKELLRWVIYKYCLLLLLLLLFFYSFCLPLPLFLFSYSLFI